MAAYSSENFWGDKRRKKSPYILAALAIAAAGSIPFLMSQRGEETSIINHNSAPASTRDAQTDLGDTLSSQRSISGPNSETDPDKETDSADDKTITPGETTEPSPGGPTTVPSGGPKETGTQRPVVSTECTENHEVVTAPATDLADVVQGASAGTTFCLTAGTYKFSDVTPKDNMKFIGAARATVIVDGTGNENAFHGLADKVTIANMTFTNFNGNGGVEQRQEQAPIRGTSALWATDRGKMATRWTVDNIVSEKNYASGLLLGDDFTVKNSIFRNNPIVGIGGDEIVGGHIVGNHIYGNGKLQANGPRINGAGIKIGKADSRSNPIVVEANTVYQNTYMGIWCDPGCVGFNVINNTIYDHERPCIYLELSRFTEISGNTTRNCGKALDFNHGAIKLSNTAEAKVRNNKVSDAKSGLIIYNAQRPAPHHEYEIEYLDKNKIPSLNFVTEDITVSGNTFTDVTYVGLSIVKNGRVDKPETIRFENNTYNGSAHMTFLWDEQRLTYSKWKTSTRN